MADRPYLIGVTERRAKAREDRLNLRPPLKLIEEREVYLPAGTTRYDFKLVLSEADEEKYRIEP